MAQFGPHFGKPFDDLDRVIREILAATSTLANLWRNLGAPENAERNRAFMLTLEARIWAGAELDGNPDAIATRVDAIVSEVETLARPKIDRASEGWRWRKQRKGGPT
jgi:hypothetical protein